MLQKHTRIKDILAQFDRTDLLEYERRQLTKHLHVEIDSIWHSDELKRVKPTPADEARSGIAIVENILWHSVPRFLRKLDDILEQEFNTSLPPDFAPLKFASWYVAILFGLCLMVEVFRFSHSLHDIILATHSDSIYPTTQVNCLYLAQFHFFLFNLCPLTYVH